MEISNRQTGAMPSRGYRLVRIVSPPKLWLLLAVLATAGSIVMAYIAQRAGESPREATSLVATQPELDLGKVEQGPVTARFDLVNRSSNPVGILRVLTSCGCTEAKILAKELAPSEHIDLSCIWDTRGMHGKSETSLVVIYKDEESGGTESCKLVVRADVIPEFVWA
jgi:hypothetical protein